MRVRFQKRPIAEWQDTSWPGQENYETFSAAKYRMQSTESRRSEWEGVCRGWRSLESPLEPAS